MLVQSVSLGWIRGVYAGGVCGAHLDPESCCVGGDISPVLGMAQVPVMQRHLDGRVDAISNTVYIPGVHSDGAAKAWRAAHKL